MNLIGDIKTTTFACPNSLCKQFNFENIDFDFLSNSKLIFKKLNENIIYWSYMQTKIYN